MEAERERLQRLYGEMGEEHLLDLAKDQDDLTDEARFALEGELRRRGIAPKLPEPVAAKIEPTVEPLRETGFEAGVPGILPGGASEMEFALDEQGGEKNGMSRLIALYDGLELSKALGFLEDEGLEPAVEAIAADGAPQRFEIWVETPELDEGRALLRTKMGLFPLAEAEDPEAGEGDPMGRVGQFEDEVEAEQMRAMLADRGFTPEVERVEDDDSGEVLWLVTVDPAEHTRAIAAVAEELGLE